MGELECGNLQAIGVEAEAMNPVNHKNDEDEEDDCESHVDGVDPGLVDSSDDEDEVRPQRKKYELADDDYDQMIRTQWEEHLKAMRPGLARSKGWGGQYWRRWLDSVILESGDDHDDREQSLESVVELPPSAEDDRHVRPALSAEEQQGGRAESKLDLSREGPALESEAKVKSEVVEKSASKIREAAAEQVRQRKTAGRESSHAIGNVEYGEEVEDEIRRQRHNDQVSKILCKLWESGAGRRAILTAIAEKQGILDPNEIEKLQMGKSSTKLQVPLRFRETLQDIGLGDVLAPVHILEFAEL